MRYSKTFSALLMAGIVFLSGCSEFDIIERYFSPTKPQRISVRNIDHNDAGIVIFVHGFNSSNEEAWGSFPTLLKDDTNPKLSTYDIVLFGYPATFCGDLASIQKDGEYLASYLKDVVPRYQNVVLVGHSMGGLVIMKSLFKLERDNRDLLVDPKITVTTFGTPYGGVKQASYIPALFCQNRKIPDLEPLNEASHNIRKDWEARFNKRGTPRIDLYAFFGARDEFVNEASACDIPGAPCDAVDGDHVSMVKPENRDWMSYSKLKLLLGRPRVKVTWERYKIPADVEGQDVPDVSAQWTDIEWNKSLGWLSGTTEAGGGGGYVGKGILLRTTDRGSHWTKLPDKSIASGSGLFCWGPCAPNQSVQEACKRQFCYNWDQVGPITSLFFYRPPGYQMPLGFMTSVTGLYGSSDAGERWSRLTPPPETGYAHFGNMAAIEGFHEIYLVGWQGIAHGIPGIAGQDSRWELEHPTFSYAISNIRIGRDREAWAVGHAPNNNQNKYKGAIYYKPPRSAQWRQLSVSDVTLEEDLSFTDIVVFDNNTKVLIVGQRGLILLGTRMVADAWTWKKIKAPTTKSFNSAQEHQGILWVAGEDGTLLISTDLGHIWSSMPIILEGEGKMSTTINRIKILENGIWLLGNSTIILGKREM